MSSRPFTTPAVPHARGRLGWKPRVAAAVALTTAAVLLGTGAGGTRADAAGNAPTAAGAAASGGYPRTPLWVYGHSFTVSPGIIDTPGQEWMPKLTRQLSMPAWRTFGVGSSRLIDTFGDLSGQAARAPVAGSAWTAARHGVVVLQSEFNDMVDPAPGGALRALPLSGVQTANYGQTLQASLAVLASSARADWSTAASAGPWRTSAGPAYLGGSLVYTTTPGAYRQMTVDVGASGTVWLLTWEIDRGLQHGAGTGSAAITVDGRLRAAVPARVGSWQTIFSRRAGGYTHNVGPRATRISGLTPGRHVIRVSKADSGPGAVYLDQLLTQASAPVPVVVVKDPDPLTSGNWITEPGNRTAVVANRQLLDAQIDAVTRQFANVTTVSLAGMPTVGYGADGVHPSDAGMDFEAGQVAVGIRTLLARYAPPSAVQ